VRFLLVHDRDMGRRHYLGRYWCATGRRLVVYESRLELARIMAAAGPGNAERREPIALLVDALRRYAGALRRLLANADHLGVLTAGHAASPEAAD
jgi:hypothetical protein